MDQKTKYRLASRTHIRYSVSLSNFRCAIEKLYDEYLNRTTLLIFGDKRKAAVSPIWPYEVVRAAQFHHIAPGSNAFKKLGPSARKVGGNFFVFQSNLKKSSSCLWGHFSVNPNKDATVIVLL